MSTILVLIMGYNPWSKQGQKIPGSRKLKKGLGLIPGHNKDKRSPGLEVLKKLGL